MRNPDSTDDANPGMASPVDAVSLPSHIGTFAILGLLGEGAMGRVYLAREANPPREVALKVVSAHSRHAFERFQREVETLAQLEHVGIARLYGAGVDGVSGQAWFSMERIQGEDLATHCQQQQTPLSVRVAMLIRVCEAVSYAHSRGVLHRDLKPANILVDTNGQPKVLDFGIARLKQSEHGNLTQAGQVLGTLPYMSPEQLSGSPSADDVRSDVYALGAVAYELLSGQLPHPRLKTSTLFEALSIVRDEIPVPLQQLNRATRGDLATVVMTALTTEPERRYASAQAFADDLQRVLSHRPIEARAPSASYVLSRFARRHRALTFAMLSIALVLVAATIVSVRFAINAAQARDLAAQRAAEAEATVNFLDDMLAAANPEQSKGGDVTVLSMLDASARTLGSLEKEPTVLVRAARTLSRTYQALGRHDAALAMIQRAITVQSKLGISGSPLAGELMHDRIRVLLAAGRHDEAGASIAPLRAMLAELTPENANELQTRLIYTEAMLKSTQDDAELGAEMLQRFLEVAHGLPSDDIDVESAKISLANHWRRQGRLKEALSLLDELIATRTEMTGEFDQRTLQARLNRASVLESLGQFDASAKAARDVLQEREVILGKQHPDSLKAAQILANSLLRLKRAEEALPFAKRATEGFEHIFGISNTQTQVAMISLAWAYEDTGQFELALDTYSSLIEVQRAAGSVHTEALSVRNNYAMLLHKLGHDAAAIDQLRELLPIVEQQLGRDHPYYAMFQSNFGLCLAADGQTDQAKTELEEAIVSLEKALGSEHDRTRTARERRAALEKPNP